MEMSTLIFITTLLILPLVIPAFALCWLYSKGTESSLQNNRRYENLISELGRDLRIGSSIKKYPQISGHLGKKSRTDSYQLFLGKMEKVREIKEEVFDTILIGAIEDLRKSGLDDEEIFPIIEEQFGFRCARKYIEKARNDS